MASLESYLCISSSLDRLFPLLIKISLIFHAFLLSPIYPTIPLFSQVPFCLQMLSRKCRNDLRSLIYLYGSTWLPWASKSPLWSPTHPSALNNLPIHPLVSNSSQGFPTAQLFPQVCKQLISVYQLFSLYLMVWLLTYIMRQMFIM